MPRPENENWYLVLDLEFDPPVEDEIVIQKRIDEKKDFWNRNANGLKGNQYSLWRDAIPKIKREMIGPDNIRKELAREACELRYGNIDDMIRMVGLKGNITNSEVINIANQLKTTETIVRKRASVLKISIVADAKPKFDAKAIYDKYYAQTPASEKSFSSLPALLSTMGYIDLYDFLYGRETRSDNMAAEALKTRATEKRKEYIHNDQKSSNGQRLCGQCEIAFASEASKKGYDEYLQYLARKQILDNLKKLASISNMSLVEAQFENFVNQMTAVVRDADLAEMIVTSFCEVENIKYLVTSTYDKTLKKKCRCGFYNEKTRNVCSQCGLPLEIECPSCGKNNPAFITFCDCGFDMNNIDRSYQLCDIAADDLKCMNLDAAELHLSQAKALWKGNPKIGKIEADLKGYGDGVREALKNLNSYISEKKFYAAEKVYSQLRNKYGYKDNSIEVQIRDAKAEAERLFNSAKCEISKNKEEALNLCNSAFNACKDYPGIQSYILQHFAPEAPINIKTVCDTIRKCNVVSWTAKDRSSDIRYKVIRKLNSSPANINDGFEVGTVSMCSITDTKINAGEAYYYAVYAERTGTFSKTGLISREPVINLFEVSGLSVALGDGSLELLWTTLPKNSVVHIYQIESTGIQREIKSLDSHHTNYVVSGLNNGSKYRFKLCLEYTINGKSVKTNGKEISGIPIQPPKPVETMSVQFEKDDNFMITWHHIGNGEIHFYHSTSEPKYRLGDTVSLSEIERQFSELQTFKQPRTTDMAYDENKATFKYSNKEKFFVFAITVESGAAVFGAVIQAAKVGTVSIDHIREISGQIFVYIKAPEKAVAFYVLYSYDKQPVSLNDESCEKRYIKYKEYASRGALIIPNAKSKKYYISISAEFADGGIVTNSPLVNYVFNNIGKSKVEYTITLKKSFIRSNAELVFFSNTDTLSLPDIDIVRNRNRVPMFYNRRDAIFGIRDGGKTIELLDSNAGKIDIRQEKGKTIIIMSVPKEKDLYIKPFIIDPTSKASTELSMSGGSYKIS